MSGARSGPSAGRTAAVAEFRFYEELNDFLDPRHRQRSFQHGCAEGATVKQAIEALGVPHTEVELVLVDGESVDFARRLAGGERVAVYPRFEALDITPLLRVRERALREPRFLADAHFGALARYLRMLGFDTELAGGLDDAAIVARAVAERRVVLTRDRELLKRRALTHGCYLRARRALEQAREVVARLDLAGLAAPFTRCTRCNGVLVAAPREAVAARVPRGVRERFAEFATCPGCARVYWRGSHHARMQRLVAWILERPGGPEWR